MELIEIKVEGTTPLLCHNPLGMQNARPEMGKKKNPTNEEDAAASVYYDMAGRIAHPMAAFRGCLVSAAKGRRIGKTAATTIVKGSVFAADEWAPLTDPTGEPLTEWEVDARRVVVQRNAIIKGRARFPKWSAVVRFEHDPDFISRELIRELLEIGGRTIGVGDYRPEKSGPFGRFSVQ